MAIAEERSAKLACPTCQSSLALIAALHGRQIACNQCGSILRVSSAPWGLTLVAPAPTRMEVMLPPVGTLARPCPICQRPLHVPHGVALGAMRCRGCGAVLHQPSADGPLARIPPATAMPPSAPATASMPPTAVSAPPDPTLAAASVEFVDPEDAAIAALGEEPETSDETRAETGTSPTGLMPPDPGAAAAASATDLAMSESSTGETHVTDDSPFDTASPTPVAPTSVAEPPALPTPPVLTTGGQTPSAASAVEPSTAASAPHAAEAAFAIVQARLQAAVQAAAGPAVARPAATRPAESAPPEPIERPRIPDDSFPRTRTFVEPRREGGRPWSDLLLKIVAVAAVVGLGVLGWRWVSGFFGGYEEARWLPRDARSFVSLRLSDLLSSPAQSNLRQLPLLSVVENYEVFLHSAGWNADEVERINAGESAETRAVVATYTLRKSVDAAELARRDNFRTWSTNKPRVERTAGVEVYSFGRFALAGPAPQTIAVGETQTLSDALANRRGKIDAPLREALAALDFSKTFVAARLGLPRRPGDAGGLPAAAAAAVRATADELDVASGLEFRRTFYTDDAAAAESLRGTLQRVVTAEAQNPATSADAHDVLRKVELSAVGKTVVMRLTLSETELRDAALHAVQVFFD